ncbi:MAG: DUF4397 domain-containing protein [Anaerolineae bacterium]
MNRTLKYILVVLMGLMLLAACDTAIPSPPPVTVVITAVDDTAALNNAVADVLTATAQLQIGMTETVFAQGGITLTPSDTPTVTISPTFTATRFVTPTRTPTPTSSPTPTFEHIEANQIDSTVTQGAGWVRIVNNWVETVESPTTFPVDVFVNDERIAREVAFGEQTNYYQVAPGAVRISLQRVDEPLSGVQAQPPILSSILEVKPGDVASMIVADLGKGLSLIPILEDPSPLPNGMARVTIAQFNSILSPVNMLVSDKRLELSRDIAAGTVVGPLDIPSGNYNIDLYDSTDTEQLITSLPSIDLSGQLSYLLVMLPPANVNEEISRFQLINSLTGRLDTDIGVRFVNALPNSGTIDLSIGETEINDLAVGNVSNTIPVSVLGDRFAATSTNRLGTVTPLGNANLGPWVESGSKADKIVLIYPNTDPSLEDPIKIAEFDQNPPRSAINASIRLIHGLSGTVPLNLQIHAVRTIINENGQAQGQETTPWIPIGQAVSFGTASEYFSRNPEVYEVRVLQSGSQTLIASLPPQVFLAGGVYDFIVLPGAETGSAQLVLVQPGVQVTQLVNGEGNPTAVYEAVAATLTAAAPVSTATPTRAASPTSTRTPVLTNTPRPTNTPDNLLPILLVNPAPPETVIGSINIRGENFQPGLPYVITLDNGTVAIVSGRTNDDGSLLGNIPLPESLPPGLHSLRVCVDCRVRGAQQAQYAQFIVADPRVTATATAQP